MAKGKKLSTEQIVMHLRQAEVELSQGITVEEMCRKLSISIQSYYRWRKNYGGLQVDQAKKFKDPETYLRAFNC